MNNTVEPLETMGRQSNESNVAEKPNTVSVRNKNLLPEDLPQADELDFDDKGEIYKAKGEIFRVLKELLEIKKSIKFPDIILPTASKSR